MFKLCQLFCPAVISAVLQVQADRCRISDYMFTYLMFIIVVLSGTMANVVVVNCPENAIVVKFKVKEGSVVSNGTLLCEYKLLDTNKCCKLKSNLNGTVKELLAKEGDELQLG